MPLEATPSNEQLHDLSYVTKIDLGTIQLYLKQIKSFDRYVAEGENIEGLDLSLAKGKAIEAKARQLMPDKIDCFELVGHLKGKAPLS